MYVCRFIHPDDVRATFGPDTYCYVVVTKSDGSR